jgi:hypothetical protein
VSKGDIDVLMAFMNLEMLSGPLVALFGFSLFRSLSIPFSVTLMLFTDSCFVGPRSGMLLRVSFLKD